MNLTLKEINARPVPWLRIFTSVPLLAVVVAQLSFALTGSAFQTYMPTYLKEVLYLDLRSVSEYFIMFNEYCYRILEWFNIDNSLHISINLETELRIFGRCASKTELFDGHAGGETFQFHWWV